MLLRGEEDTRIRFLGAPAGYEFVSLIEALVMAGTLLGVVPLLVVFLLFGRQIVGGIMEGGLKS